MNKVWWMVLSGVLSAGISFNAAAMTQSELAAAMASSAETTTARAAKFNQDFERIIKARTAEGKTVKVDNYGSFSQGEKATHMGVNPARGKPGQPAMVEVTTWHKIKSTGSVSNSALIKELAATGGYSQAEAARLLGAKVSTTAVDLKKGGTLTDNGGLGAFSVKRQAARSGKTPTGAPYVSPAKNIVQFKASIVSAGMKFTPAKRLRGQVN